MLVCCNNVVGSGIIVEEVVAGRVSVARRVDPTETCLDRVSGDDRPKT